MKLLKHWLIALLVVVTPITGMAATGIACCEENAKVQVAAGHEHHAHHHDAAGRHDSMHDHGHQVCHCAHCAMGCGSACVPVAAGAIAVDLPVSDVSDDTALAQAATAHHLDPFRPPIGSA